jgi:acyl-CoA thioester hydrolase
MDDAFQTTLEVRLFDCDAQGHLAGAAYLNYANHALWSCLRSAGVDVSALLRDGFGPVHLETKVRFLSEFRAGDIVTLTCTLIFDGGKTYRVRNEFRKHPNTLAAEGRACAACLIFPRDACIPIRPKNGASARAARIYWDLRHHLNV